MKKETSIHPTTFIQKVISFEVGEHIAEMEYKHVSMKRINILFGTIKKITPYLLQKGEQFESFIITREVSLETKEVVKLISKTPIDFETLRRKFL